MDGCESASLAPPRKEAQRFFWRDSATVNARAHGFQVVRTSSIHSISVVQWHPFPLFFSWGGVAAPLKMVFPKKGSFFFPLSRVTEQLGMAIWLGSKFGNPKMGWPERPREKGIQRGLEASRAKSDAPRTLGGFRTPQTEKQCPWWLLGNIWHVSVNCGLVVETPT